MDDDKSTSPRNRRRRDPQVHAEPGEPQYRDIDGNPVLAEYQDPGWRWTYVEWRGGFMFTANLLRSHRGHVGGRLFKLRYRDEAWPHPIFLFPMWQFDSRLNPLPIVSELVDLVEQHSVEAWRIAWLLDSENDFFGTADGPPARRPMEFLRIEPSRVVKVLRRELGLTEDV